MAIDTVHCSRLIPHISPEKIWNVLRHFDNQWHPDISRCQLIADSSGATIREFTDHDGQTYKEQLTYFSDTDRTITYCHLSGIKDVHHYEAQISVLEAKGGASMVKWNAKIDATEARINAICEGTRFVFERALDWLQNNDLPNAAPVPRAPRVSKNTEIVRLTVDGVPELSILTPAPGLGDADTLCLFLHGIGGNAENWLPQLNAFGKSRHVAALDMRGYGQSNLSFHPSRIDDYCDDIIRVADAFSARKVLLVGLSMGAWIATSFAMRHPEKLAGLMLAGGCTGMSEAAPEERESFRAYREKPLDQGKTPADFASEVVKLITSPNASSETKSLLRQSMSAISPESYRDALNCFCNPPEHFDFSLLPCPVLLVTGLYDRLATPEEIRNVSLRMYEDSVTKSRVRVGLPDIRFEVIKKSGHVCNLEYPGSFNRLLAGFLSRIAGTQKDRGADREQKRWAKGQRIKAAALSEFCEHGYDGASMESIAKRAEVSKPTLYQYFGDKEKLFSAVLDKGRVVLLTPLTRPGRHLVERLWDFSWVYADFVLQPDMLSLARLVLGEASRRPDSAIAYHQSGPGKAIVGITGFIQRCVNDGVLMVDDVELAAQDLWSLILSSVRDRHLHYTNEKPGRITLLKSISHELEVFLTVYSTHKDDDLAILYKKVKQMKNDSINVPSEGPGDVKQRFTTVAVVDTNGLLRGQKIAASSLEHILKHGMGMAPAQLALDPTDVILEMPGVTDDNGDFHDSVLQIDTDSLRRMPWESAEDATLYLAEFTGETAAICPRSLLRRVLERASGMGIVPKYGMELEFTLFNETSKSLQEKNFDNLETATPHPSHDLLIYQSLQSDFYGEVADICDPLKIKLAKMHEEIGGGFMEACIHAGIGLGPADQAVLFKNFLRVLAMRRGQLVSYMPRWSEQADSQSSHIHISLEDRDGNALFWDENKSNRMSPQFHHFIGGLQTYLPDLMLAFAPTVNAWRRFAEGTFAPPAYTWGIENRTCCMRVVGDTPSSLRVENRLPGSDTNPHIVVAATLAAGLAGIANKTKPTEHTVGNGYLPGVGFGEPLLDGMDKAIETLQQSDMAKDWLGESFVQAYAATRRAQLNGFEDKDLIDERRRFFELG